MKNHLPIGRILSPHGADGMVKIQPWCDGADVICGLKRMYILDVPPSLARGDVPQGQGEVAITIRRAFPHKSHACVKIEGIDTIEDAKKLHGITVYAARADLDIPEGSYFIVDLLGTPVIDANSGRVYGKLTSVNTATRNHIYEIATGGGMVMLPAVEEYIADIRPGEGIYVTPIEGFFDGE